MLPVTLMAGAVLVAATSSVAFRVNCPVSTCLSQNVVEAVASKVSPDTLLDAGTDDGV